MPEAPLRLYADAQFASPYATSVFVALQEKQLTFELFAVDLGTGANRAEPYAVESLTQRVPTLVHGDFALSESTAITEYLDETFPETPIYPRDRNHRARARQLQAWLRSDLMPIRQERSTEVVFYKKEAPALSAAAELAVQKLYFAVDRLLSLDASNLFGDWCIADTDLALMLNRLVMNGDKVPAKLASYAMRQWEREAVQQWVKLDRPPL
ncbi:glutathione transferase [Paraburkholderia phenoliruptrix]|uniref:Glutathione S-transferase-like protein n=2 Tax=Paraburkholderia phenoliruptrix TaxID=252970 RepID=K0DFX9_9BURK|nr:glutathione transferase [Paraburkholderia phenoliruptrix]AFT84876.1 Glutathione S-transferase-like protein [Paraburkholderia phenoliruptrix BR3459a]CAB4050412.1 Glutathione S-transferase YfcF [Paraburkholderia phenoliruptrix]